MSDFQIGGGGGVSGVGSQQKGKQKSPEEMIKELEGALKIEKSPEKQTQIKKQLENLHKMLDKGKGAGASGGDSAPSGDSSAASSGGDSVDLGDSNREASDSAGQIGASQQAGQIGQVGQAPGITPDNQVSGIGQTQGMGNDPSRPSLPDFTSALEKNFSPGKAA